LSSTQTITAAVLLLLVSGCSRYWPLPLTQQAVVERLRPPPNEQLSISAEQIKHPILHPIQFDADNGLTPDEISLLAVLLNPTLRSERDRRALSCAQLLQAGLLPNPQFNWNLASPTGGMTQGAVNEWGLGLNWEITSLIGRSARIAAAAAQPSAVLLDVAWQEWVVAESSKSAAYTLIGLQQQAGLVRQLNDRLREKVAVVHQAVDLGLKTGLDLAAADAASSQVHANLLDLESQIAQQQIALNRLLGRPAETEVRIQGDIKLPTALPTPPADKLIDCLAERRLDLVGLRYGYASQEATLRAAVLAQFPKINIGVTNARDNGNVVSTGFGITIDLPIFDRNQGVIAQEKATRQKLYDEYVNRFFQARTDIFMLLTQIKWLNEQIAAAQVAQSKQEQLVETYRVAVEKGQADVIVYYTAWTTLTERQIETVKLQQALVEARVALELAAGIYDLECVASSTAPEELPPPILLKSSEAWP
jgi:cobalt-zinc-cadmium efflux system outer membrane protein